MHVPWCDIFGNHAPIEVEIGPGTGTFLLAAARERTHTNFFAIERSHSRAARLQEMIATGLRDNVRVLCADAACVITTLIPAESVTAYHIYFPDPWWKRRHQRRRLFGPDFAAALSRTLVPGGCINIATDVDDTFALALQTLEAEALLLRDHTIRSLRVGPTAFERKGLARGASIKEAVFVKRAAAPTIGAREGHLDYRQLARQHPPALQREDSTERRS